MDKKRILIACSHFWPSVGGLETSMGQLGSELVADGYDVTVMTLAFPARTADVHQGVRIVSVAMAELQGAIRAAVASGEYDACLLIQDPLGTIPWSIEGLARPARTRVLVQPIINEDGYARWKDNAEFRQRLAAILKNADAALTMTKSGPDQRFMLEAGVEPVYLPNASAQLAPAGDFRAQFGIPAERFLILHVANLYWVKNHVGLIDALAGMPADWQLVMIGNPTGASDCVEAVQAKLASRPEVRFIPGLPPEWVAAAMQAADVVVLASHGEGSPITLLEAMSQRKPWLATPTCGAANDHLGGLICPLSEFQARLRQLAAQPALRQALGELSYAHWQQCYAWPVVLQGWKDLIDTGRLQRSFAPDPALVARQQQLVQALGEAPPLVSVVVIVYNHARYLEKALDAIEVQELAGGLEIVIHDDCSTDGSAEICRQFAARSRHRVKLILQPQNKIGRQLGIWRDIYRQCSGTYIAISDGDDFWMHPHKLAQQCQALDLLPQVDLAFHKTARVHWQNDGVLGYLGDYGEEPRLFSVHEVIEGDGGFVPTPSIMFRRALVQTLPDWYFEHVAAGDYCLQVFAALRGGAVYLPMCAAAYRQGDPTSWSQQTTADIHKVNRFDYNFTAMLFQLQDSLPAHCVPSIERLMLGRFLQFCQRCFLHGRLDDVAPLAALIGQRRNSAPG